MTQNPMVPSTDWYQLGEEFRKRAEKGPQVLLCATCVTDLGLTTPPAQVVILDGQSLCLEHLHKYTPNHPHPEQAP